jgi:hypothetical protein
MFQFALCHSNIEKYRFQPSRREKEKIEEELNLIVEVIYHYFKFLWAFFNLILPILEYTCLCLMYVFQFLLFFLRLFN